jgi:hypothetical protein
VCLIWKRTVRINTLQNVIGEFQIIQRNPASAPGKKIYAVPSHVTNVAPAPFLILLVGVIGDGATSRSFLLGRIIFAASAPAPGTNFDSSPAPSSAHPLQFSKSIF